jgi:ribosomal protein L11 methyltransferase
LTHWIALSLEADRKEIPDLARLFTECGGNGFEEAPPAGIAPTLIQPWEADRKAPTYTRVTLRTWLDEKGAAQAKNTLSARFPHLEFHCESVDEQDWSEIWKQHHHRIVVCEGLTIAPPWEAQPGDLIIPPGNAFGTGEHPSTFECMRKIVALAGSCTRCLDVGCGSGILALTAARLGLQAVGIDIDKPSVRSAIENAERNGLAADFSTTPLQSIPGAYDLVVANLFAEVLTALAPDLLRVTQKHLILAGILNEKADWVIEALSPDLAVQDCIESGAWTCLHMVRAR